MLQDHSASLAQDDYTVNCLGMQSLDFIVPVRFVKKRKKGKFDEHSLFLRHPFRFLRSIRASLEISAKRNFDTSRVIYCKEIGNPCHNFVIRDNA